MFKNFKTLFILIIVNFLSADEVEFKVSAKKEILDDSWKFIPGIPKSFDNYGANAYRLDLRENNFGIHVKKESFSGSGTREVYPKNIDSRINSEELGINFFINDKTQLNLIKGKSKTDPEYFDCYQKGSLIIGGCADSDFQITSTLDKYEILGDNLLFIEGKTESSKIELIINPDSKLIDYFATEISYKKIDFDWLTPVEDITSSVILDSTVNGVRVGTLIDSLLLDLPQRDSWKTYILSFRYSKEFNFKNLDFFVEQKLLYGNRKDFYKFNDEQKYNIKSTFGFGKKFNSFEVKFMGNLYTNFFLWEKEELYNHRTEKYFNDEFGSLTLELKYEF
tara:strand:+ start:136 stop:1143 length:1008 start_codon:yes stop_codon:yes gene_type:complete